MFVINVQKKIEVRNVVTNIEKFQIYINKKADDAMTSVLSYRGSGKKNHIIFYAIAIFFKYLPSTRFLHQETKF